MCLWGHLSSFPWGEGLKQKRIDGGQFAQGGVIGAAAGYEV